MTNDWNKLDPENSKGPISWAVNALIVIFVIGLFAGALGWVGGWVGDAGKVVQDQVKPSVLLKKYEWFKDVAAQLDTKTANIKAAELRIEQLSAQYEGVKRNQWARTDAEQYNLWQTEVAGLKANYNSLAAEYNAAMAKVNFRFTNVGELPQGAAPLPRQFREYQ